MLTEEKSWRGLSHQYAAVSVRLGRKLMGSSTNGKKTPTTVIID